MFWSSKKFEETRDLAIADLTNFLVSRFGFTLEEAFRASQEFWKKYEKKLKEVL